MVFLQQVINGLAQGGIYALIAIGWTTVFGIVGVMNWTHGEIYMLGAYAGYFLTTMGLPMVPALLLSMAVGSLIAMAVDHFGYRPLRKAGTLATSGFITALGLSTFLRYTANAVFTVNPRAYPELVEYRLITLFTFKGQAITISSMHLMILIGTVIIMIILELFIRKTLVGKAMLAASQDMQTLGLMGADSEKLIKITFAISGALGAAAGFFIGTIYSINPMMGALAGLKGWSCAILGGIGSITGSLVGGILLGIAENLTAGFISTGYKDAIGFVIMILVLIIRPTGFMGYKFEEKV
ncbi:MAG: branched-chain amino acid ABC transporter permease [Lachnospiraceae bacterium]|nr:branched-chain amino acid ABC transporter permease [Lachnospiraceae bacterium]MDD7023347.1 branched-chain amino acid ABC transporter permease [Oscillospiraceae bacterium]MDY5541198.1 branched-chain amino acid ABC transporter permease [Lachnospiraceae bacterium]MDY5649383.1 branched-chain amino acid ABC transporter permease [Lachnospiraceae bacterium]